MTRRDFLKGTAGFVLLCGAGFGASKLLRAFGPTAETVVGPLLADGLDILPLADGAEISCRGLTCFTVNGPGARLVTLADGRRTLEKIIRTAGLEDQAEAVADFYITLGKAGYLQNRVEVNKVAVQM